MDNSGQISLPKLPHRPDDGHKGTFGTVGIIGGSNGAPGTKGDPESIRARMIGAPALAAMGATRAGCGLVKIAAPDAILNTVLTLAPNATGYPILNNTREVLERLASESDSIVIGPGLGTDEIAIELVRSASQLQPSIRCKSLLIDADGLNAFTQLDPLPSSFALPVILTPHPGEAERLLSAYALDGNPSGDHDDRIHTCSVLAQHLGCIVVLKGKGTVVSDGKQTWTCKHGHPCLATGGTGDVLSGMIASLAAQCIDHPRVDLFSSTCIAVEAHAQAGVRWAEFHQTSAGLNPQDLAEHIPAVMSDHR
jgi:hydroxyethylthiazole kinase-like uncharacterized protein yjeF